MKKRVKSIEKTSLLEKFREEDSSLFLDMVIEIHNSSCMYVTGCERIKDYSPACIRLACVDGDVVISGERLRVEGLVNSQISISGRISGVSFCND